MNFLRNRVVLATICIVLAIVIGFGAIPLFTNIFGKTVKIVFATRDISAGTRLTEDMFEIKEIRAEAAPPNFLKDINLVTKPTELFNYLGTNKHLENQFIESTTVSGQTTTTTQEVGTKDRIVTIQGSSNKFDLTALSIDGNSMYAITDILSGHPVTLNQINTQLTPSAMIRNMKPDEAQVSFPIGSASIGFTVLPNDIIQILSFDTEGNEYVEIPSLKAVTVVCATTEKGEQILYSGQKGADGNIMKPHSIVVLVNKAQARDLATATNGKFYVLGLINGKNQTEANRLLNENIIID